MLALAALWERFELGGRRWLRGREVSLGPLRLHTTNLVSGLMFVVLGVVFIVYEGTSALSGVYVALGTEDLAYSAGKALSGLPFWVSWGMTVLVVAVVLALALRGRGGGSSDKSDYGGSTKEPDPEERRE